MKIVEIEGNITIDKVSETEPYITLHGYDLTYELIKLLKLEEEGDYLYFTTDYNKHVKITIEVIDGPWEHLQGARWAIGKEFTNE